MWATLTLMSALSMTPGQAEGKLELTNVRPTYGRLGPTRPDTKYLHSDDCFISFDAVGLKFDDEGLAKYSISMEIFDSADKSIDKSLTVDKDIHSIQGSGRVPLDAFYRVKSDMKPGSYKMKVEVTDRKADKKGQLEQKFEVLEKGFGVVRVNCAYDVASLTNPPLFPACGQGMVGQTLLLNFGVTGFERGTFESPINKAKQPLLELKLRMLDDQDQSLIPKPPVEKLPKGDDPVPADITFLPLFFPLSLTKPGKYKVELTATDLVTKKTSKVVYPLVVIEAPK